MRGETRRKARRCIRRRSIAARIAVKTTGAAVHGAGERPSPRAPRRTRPEVPSAACFAAASGAEPAKMRRVAQDCDPKTYMYMSSGRKDARIGHLSRASTVAAKRAAHWTANHTRTGKPRGGKGSERTIEIRACGQPRRRGPFCEGTQRLPRPAPRIRQARTPTSRCRSSRRRSRRPS